MSVIDVERCRHVMRIMIRRLSLAIGCQAFASPMYDQVKPTIIVASDSRRYRSWGKGMTGLFPAAGHAASESIGTPRIVLKVEAIRYSVGHGFAPHVRGWSCRRGRDARGSLVCPACAGMVRKT